MLKFRRLRCSFCGKNEKEVSKLVAGPRVYICDQCVTVASRIMEGGSHDDNQPVKVKSSLWRELTTRARELFRGGSARRVSSLSPT